MVQSFRPVPTKPESGLIQIAENIWTIEATGYVYYRPPIQPRYPYPHRAVVIRLDDGSLFILSPICLTPAIRKDIDPLGTVKYLVSPNHLHHLFLGDWQQAYPQAKIYASPRLAPKRKDLSFDKTFSTDMSEPDWVGQIDWCIFGSGNGWIDEVVFFHCQSRTVIFTDFIMDFDPAILSPIARVTTSWNQMYRRTPLGVQSAHIFDRQFLRDALHTVRTWEAEHAIIAHSPWLCVDGKEQVVEFLDSAFDWLTPKPAFAEIIMGVVRLLILLLVVMPIHAAIVLIFDIIYPRLIKRSES
ncbi:hypothetical protein NIES4101_61910 [Calothrix sp. NIES-4101]|nr:hypothetical protein NIES4101_61910 [Calothrix sp. NIES-4101]